MTEKEKMQQGDWYDANNDQELLEERLKAMDLCFEYNQTKPSSTQTKTKILKQLLGYTPNNLVLLSPFNCDYGKNIKIGDNCFVNINCYFMDCAPITIGDHAYIGPSCGFYTASHHLDIEKRNNGIEKALPITIGNNCWLGANVSIMPGVTIKDNCVIGAGSVVTKDIDANSIAAGVPCKVIKKLDNKT